MLTYHSVTEVNNYIKSILDEDAFLSSITIKGEISNYKGKSSTGHLFFTLKDEKSSISVVMFSADALRLGFVPQDGDEVLVTGRVSSYPSRGQYQIYIYEMIPYGKGQALLELELLKKKLSSEGLFDESRKRAINRFPKLIGIITAKGSAACADMVKNISRRYPLCQIYLFYSLVQGNDAPKDLLRAFNKAQTYQLDTLIIGRGGGANEDLSAFNDETFVRAVSKSKMPVISAVGHEVDITLIDYVSDKRASTPTGAAEFATIDIVDIKADLANLNNSIDQSIRNRLDTLDNKLKTIKNNRFFTNPASMYKDKLLSLDNLSHRLNFSMSNLIKLKKQQVKMLSQNLNSLNPDSILSRGYAMISDSDGHMITSIQSIKLNQKIKTIVKDGIIISTVDKKEGH